MQKILETVSLFLLMAVIVLRPLVAESYDSAGSPFTSALPGISDPSPLRTLLFDLAILVAALGWLMARVSGTRRPYRRTGIELGAVLVVIAAVVSCFFAGNKRLAINATVDWLCYPLLTVTLAQLLREARVGRILVAGVIASACVQAFYCAEQYWVGFEETWEHYLTIKTQFWADQGVALDSGRVETFERRMLAHEAAGVLPHSNVTGSYLVLCGFVALGAAVACLRNGPPRPSDRSKSRSTVPALQAPTVPSWLVAAPAGIIAVSLLGAVLLTNSVGALVSAEVGLGAWLILWGYRSWLRRNRRKALTLAWAAVAFGACAVIGHGLWHKSLPGVSLAFRWQYWTTAAEMVADHPLTGVGRENFGRHYLQHKPIVNPEEVNNPHNLFVQAATDWGILGMVGLAVMLVGASIAIVRSDTEEEPRAGPAETVPSSGVWFLWGLGLISVVTLGMGILLGTSDMNWVYYKVVSTGLVWTAGFACMGLALQHPSFRNTLGTGSLPTGAALGLFTFVLHDMINFAIFVPGAATTWFAVLALCVSKRSGDEITVNRAPTSRRWFPPVLIGSALVLVFVFGIIPVADAERSTLEAKSMIPVLREGPLDREQAYVLLNDAIVADPLDPTPCVRQAQWLGAVSSIPRYQREALRLAEASIGNAIRRDPFHLKLRRMQVGLYRERASALGQEDDYLAAVDAARDALELYPLDPSGLALLADCQREAGRAVESAELLNAAVDNYREALDLDGRRLGWERLRRFRDAEKREIKANLKKAMHMRRALLKG